MFVLQRALDVGLLEPAEQAVDAEPIEAAPAADTPRTAAPGFHSSFNLPPPASTPATAAPSSAAPPAAATEAATAGGGSSSSSSPAAAGSPAADGSPAIRTPPAGSSAQPAAGSPVAGGSSKSQDSSPYEQLLADLTAAAAEPDIAIDPRFAAVRALLAAVPESGAPRLNFARSLVGGRPCLPACLPAGPPAGLLLLPRSPTSMAPTCPHPPTSPSRTHSLSPRAPLCSCKASRAAMRTSLTGLATCWRCASAAPGHRECGACPLPSTDG